MTNDDGRKPEGAPTCVQHDRPRIQAAVGANDPEHAHRLAACWNAFLPAETTEIERIDDGCGT